VVLGPDELRLRHHLADAEAQPLHPARNAAAARLPLVNRRVRIALVGARRLLRRLAVHAGAGGPRGRRLGCRRHLDRVGGDSDELPGLAHVVVGGVGRVHAEADHILFVEHGGDLKLQIMRCVQTFWVWV